jgi:alcohol dehydrogenase (cytochrome c)
MKLITTMVATAALCMPGFAMAQTADELVNGAKDTGNVVNYGMGYNLQRFSHSSRSTRRPSNGWFRSGT